MKSEKQLLFPSLAVMVSTGMECVMSLRVER